MNIPRREIVLTQRFSRLTTRSTQVSLNLQMQFGCCLPPIWRDNRAAKLEVSDVFVCSGGPLSQASVCSAQNRWRFYTRGMYVREMPRFILARFFVIPCSMDSARCNVLRTGSSGCPRDLSRASWLTRVRLLIGVCTVWTWQIRKEHLQHSI